MIFNPKYVTFFYIKKGYININTVMLQLNIFSDWEKKY